MNNDVFPNKFKAALAAKQVQIGCWSALSNPISTEVLGLAGFDWLVLDGEHAPNDISTFIPQLMALKGSASAPVVRVPTNEPVIIKRLLDIGFYNFLIPFVETKEEAEQAVASTRYPPEGIRGVSVSHRANMFGTVADYFAQSNKNITILVQIESQQGVDNVDAIAATEGVDGIFVGPSDLAAALGHLGNASHPDVQKAIQHIFNRASAHGKPSGILAPVEAATNGLYRSRLGCFASTGDPHVLKGQDTTAVPGKSSTRCDQPACAVRVRRDAANRYHQNAYGQQ